MQNIFRRRKFFVFFRNFSFFLKNSDFFEIFEKIKIFENSKIFENLIFQFSNEISEFFKNFGKFSEIFVAEKIFCISYCNFTSNKSIVDFLDIFRCRFVARRRSNRLKHANLQAEAGASTAPRPPPQPLFTEAQLACWGSTYKDNEKW